mmetsp:Transcript_105367/g.191654  ORF Transcript_105367/g.191654 Transcript_105367/m.191654 type:complete len:216 (-) Transcript_105367:739-1386(-)
MESTAKILQLVLITQFIWIEHQGHKLIEVNDAVAVQIRHIKELLSICFPIAYRERSAKSLFGQTIFYAHLFELLVRHNTVAVRVVDIPDISVVIYTFALQLIRDDIQQHHVELMILPAALQLLHRISSENCLLCARASKLKPWMLQRICKGDASPRACVQKLSKQVWKTPEGSKHAQVHWPASSQICKKCKPQGASICIFELLPAADVRSIDVDQ